MSAIVNRTTGKSRSLDRKTQPDERVNETDVQDPPKLARLLTRILRELATLRSRFFPRRIDFEDLDVDNTGTTLYRLPHGFGGRARWWAVDWTSSAEFSQGGPRLRRHSSSTANTLVLISGVAGTVTVRVEEAG